MITSYELALVACVFALWGAFHRHSFNDGGNSRVRTLRARSRSWSTLVS